MRLIGEEGGGSQPFVGVWDLAVFPTGEVLPQPPITARGLFSGSLRNGGEMSHVIDGNPATVVHNYGEGVSDDLYALDTFRFASATARNSTRRLQPRAYTQHSGCVEHGTFKCEDATGGSAETIGFIAQEVEK